MHRPYVHKVPDGKVALLCLHGILGSPAHFRPFLPYVPAAVSVFIPLLDGHGGDTKDFSKTSMQKWLAQVDAMLTSLSAEYESIYILGHSMGTLLALHTHAMHPKVRGLLLLASPLHIWVKPAAACYSLRAFLGLGSSDDAMAKAYQAAHSVALSANPFSYLGWLPRYVELFRLARSVRLQLSAVRLPCRFLQSEYDELVSSRSAHAVPKLPNFCVETLPKARHFLYTPQNIAYIGQAIRSLFS